MVNKYFPAWAVIYSSFQYSINAKIECCLLAKYPIKFSYNSGYTIYRPFFFNAGYHISTNLNIIYTAKNNYRFF
jgi:hypothetical protein